MIPLVIILLFLGLLLPVSGISFMIMEYQDRTLTPISFGCFGSAIMIGTGLLVLMAIIIVRKNEIYMVDQVAVEKDGAVVTAVKKVKAKVWNKRNIWGWIFSIGGFLILAACIKLFFQYGPINEPYISPEHEANDRIINTCCASVSLLGFVIFWIGF